MSTIRLLSTLAALISTAMAASAQQAPAEEPGWAKGRPRPKPP